MELLDKQAISLSRETIYCILQECTRKKDLAAVRRAHSLIISNGLISDSFLGDHLIRLFGSCGSLVEASEVFFKIPKPSLYTWNAIISTHAKFGKADRALEFYHRMQNASIKPDAYIFSCVLKACGGMRSIQQGRLIHDQIILNGLEIDVVLGNALIGMYARCGSLEESYKVFDELQNRDVVSWGTMIAGYAQDGQGLPGFQLFNKMQQEGIEPSKVTFLCTLKACSSIGAIGNAKVIHNEITRRGLETDVVVGSTLVDMYAKCGSLQDARNVFEKLQNRNVVTWGAMIASYAEHGQSLSALELFVKMQQEGINPSNVTFLGLLKACSNMGAIVLGRLIHDQIIASGLEKDVSVGSSLVDMYAKCGDLDEACRIFDRLPDRDVISWCAMIAGYAQHGLGHLALETFDRMQQQNIKPSKVTFLCILKACGSIEAKEQGKVIHDQIIKSGLDSAVMTASSLIDMYGKCGFLEEARKMFDTLQGLDVVLWGAMISGYVQYGQGLTALELFKKMQAKNITPDKFVFSCVLKACGSVGSIHAGRWIYSQIVRSGFELEVVIGNALIDMFAKCGSLVEAVIVFDRLPNRDVVSWGSMIAGYVQHEQGLSALELFENLHQNGIKPDKIIFLCTAKACGNIKDVEQGRLVHRQILVSGIELDVVVGSSLVDMYANCGEIREARKVFDELPNRNVVSWAVIVAGYVEQGHSLCALELFRKMQQEDVTPDKVTYVCVLKACGSIGAIQHGRLVHHQIIGSCLELDLAVGSTLVDMYAKCGNLEEAHKVLNRLSNRNVVSWGAIISGYAQCGRFCLVWQCLKDMQQEGVFPNDAIFNNVFTTCSHTGLLEDGQQLFKSMTEDHGIIPGVQQYSCMVDLLGRAGHLKEAEDLLQTMPLLPNMVVWTSLLVSCRTYGNAELGRQCFEQVAGLNPSEASGYVVMSNIYADVHMLGEFDKIQGLRNYVGASRKPGRAWMEVKSKAYEFIVGVKCHPQSDMIYSRLKKLSPLLKEGGYIPQLHLVLESLSYDNKEGTVQ